MHAMHLLVMCLESLPRLGFSERFKSLVIGCRRPVCRHFQNPFIRCTFEHVAIAGTRIPNRRDPQVAIGRLSQSPGLPQSRVAKALLTRRLDSLRGNKVSE